MDISNQLTRKQWRLLSEMAERGEPLEHIEDVALDLHCHSMRLGARSDDFEFWCQMDFTNAPLPSVPPDWRL